MPEPDGYRREELFYPLSSRLFQRSRLRLPMKVAEHPLGMMRLSRRRPDVFHFQWLPLPQFDRRLLPSEKVNNAYLFITLIVIFRTKLHWHRRTNGPG